MKHINILLIGAAFALGLTGTSCDDQLDQVNPNQATESTFWNSEEDFTKAMNSCYSPLKVGTKGGYYGTRGVMMRIARADEVEFRNDLSDVYQACFFTNNNGNALSQALFYQMYNGIYRTNSILENLELKKDKLSAEFINNLKGECYFIRAFFLFQLGKEFKNAPLRLVASQSPSTFPLAKSSQKEIWEQALSDLKEAEERLPIKSKILGKPTKGAALALTGKIHVYMENYTEAISALEPLTKSPYSYKLVEDFNWNFDVEHENNEESIFEILMEPVGGTDLWGDGENSNTTQSNTRPKEYAASEVGGWYEAVPTKQLMDEFKKELDKDGNYDYRARMSAAWDYEGCMYYMKPFREQFKEDKWNTSWILKYQNWQTQTTEPGPPMSYINERAIRYAEVVMLLAEAHLFTSNFDKAISYINQIRRRANLSDYSGDKTKNAIFAELEHQRLMEFFVEGERFYDLRRWGLLEERMKTCSSERYQQLMTGRVGDTNRYYYYPIPSKELETNPLCTPNEGW